MKFNRYFAFGLFGEYCTHFDGGMFCGRISVSLLALPNRGDICLSSLYVFEFSSILERRLWRKLVCNIEIPSHVDVLRR